MYIYRERGGGREREGGEEELLFYAYLLHFYAIYTCYFRMVINLFT